MEGAVAGSLVVVPWPFFDLSGAKRRPALVIETVESNGALDLIVALISTKAERDKYALEITASDMSQGWLDRKSYVRPLYVATIDQSMVIKTIGNVKDSLLKSVVEVLTDYLNKGR